MHHCLDIDRIGFMSLFLSLVFSLTVLHQSFAKEPDREVDDVGYQLYIEDQKINLKAEDASLKRIIEAICKEMDIEVVIRIPEEKKITIKFEDQALEKALKLMKVNYALVTDSKEDDGHIKRIAVVPEGQNAQLTMTTSGKFDQQTKSGLNQENGSNPEPFKFEFDPSKVIDKQSL